MKKRALVWVGTRGNFVRDSAKIKLGFIWYEEVAEEMVCLLLVSALSMW